MVPWLSFAQDDASCAEKASRGLGASMLAVQHTRFKSVSSVWFLRRAIQHASSRAQLAQTEEATADALDAVQQLEANIISAQSFGLFETGAESANATIHADASTTHNQTLNDTESNENRTQCRLCARAEQEFIGSLQAARDLHLRAEGLALALASAATRHQDASGDFHDFNEEFERIKQDLSELTHTYVASKQEFDAVVEMAERLHPTAVKVANAQAEKSTSRADQESAQGEYDAAAAAAGLADEEAAAKQAAETDACAGLGLPTPKPTPVSTLPVTGGLFGHWDAMATGSFELDGTAVAMWGDLSGKGLDVMAPAKHRPELKSDCINGHPGVYFSGAEKALASAATHPTFEFKPFTWIVVVNSKGSGMKNIFSTNDAPWEQLNKGWESSWRSIALTTSGYHGWGGPSDIRYAPVPQNQMKVLTLWFNGVVMKIYHGKQKKAQKEAAGFHEVKEGYVVMGHAMQNSHDYTGYIGEAVAYTRALAEADVFKVVDALEEKWA